MKMILRCLGRHAHLKGIDNPNPMPHRARGWDNDIRAMGCKPAPRRPRLKYALIAGNGRFPLLVLEAARGAGRDMVVVAVREEADRAIQNLGARCHWVSLGELGKLIEILKEEGVTHAVMAGQIKHAQIFSSIRPDWRLLKLLTSLRSRAAFLLWSK
jgi:hypothetical protein